MNFDPATTSLKWIPDGGEPVDLSGYVTSVQMERVTEENFLDEWTKPIRIRIKSRAGFSPFGYRLLFGRTHPRLKRMHAAYGRRRR